MYHLFVAAVEKSHKLRIIINCRAAPLKSEARETLVVLLSKMAKGEYFSSTAKCHC